MRTKWLVFAVAAVLAGVAGCGGSDDGGATAGGGATGGSGGATGGSGGAGASAGAGGAGATGGSSGSGATGSGGSGAIGAGGSCGSSIVVTYDITGVFSITDTTFGLGDAQRNIGTGELAIRFTASGGNPADGTAQLVSYRMPMQFNVETAGLSVDTDVVASSGPDSCGIAWGALSGTTLGWDTCDYPGGNDWTPDQSGTGIGCVADYNSKGTVTCTDNSAVASCSQGNLQDGANAQDSTWNQPLNSFEFASDLSSFSMGGGNGNGVETPNSAQGRTWFTLDGTETGRIEEDTPGCACP